MGNTQQHTPEMTFERWFDSDDCPMGTDYDDAELGWKAAHSHVLELKRQLKIANLKNASSLANNLCSGHRDKQQGKPCLACEIERLEGALNRAGCESSMVTLKRDADGKPTAWCDPEIAPVVQHLIDNGVETVASCSGHGHLPPTVCLKDGRCVIIAKDVNEMNRMMAVFGVDINGNITGKAGA